MSDIYDQTSGALAREARVSVPLVQRYADMKLLDYLRSTDGTRLFRRGQAKRVRAIKARRLGNRGRRKDG